LTSFHAISNHLCPSFSRDPLPLRCRLYFVRTSSLLSRLVTGTDRIEFTLRRLLPPSCYGLELLFQLLSTRGYSPDAVTFRYWPYSVGQVGNFHPAVMTRSQAHMRIGEADHASPPSQTGRALLTHPAFRSADWLPRPTCEKKQPEADRRAAPATAVFTAVDSVSRAVDWIGSDQGRDFSSLGV